MKLLELNYRGGGWGATSWERGDGRDVIAVDVPLFIRLLEWAREDAKADVPLHVVAANAVKLLQGKRGPLSMRDYARIVPGRSSD